MKAIIVFRPALFPQKAILGVQHFRGVGAPVDATDEDNLC